MSDHPLMSALTIIEVLYVVVLCAWILLEKRSPAATLAWIFGLVALPGAGFVIYFFLGPRRIRRRRLKRQRAQQSIARPDVQADTLANRDPGVLRDASQLVRLGEVANKSPLSLATRHELLIDGAATYAAILGAIRSAREHVHVLYYIFEPDATGRELLNALVERAKAGVKVRLLVDAVGSAAAVGDESFFEPLRRHGAEVAVFNPVSFGSLWGRVLNFRNHRKIVVVDGRIGFTGGLNVTDEENPERRPDAWRDTHLCLEGPCVNQLQIVFLEDWCYVRGSAPDTTGLFPEPSGGEPGGELVQILDSGPDKEHETIKSAYFAAISAAASRVWLSMAYFVPDEAMGFVLKAAALRGVDVRILLPKRSDSRTVALAARSYYDELLRTGVRIFEYEPRMLHAKTLLVDDWFAAVGTANYDNRSFRQNFEVSALVYGRKLADELGASFERDLESAKQVTLAARLRLALPQRLFEGAARVLSPVL